MLKKHDSQEKNVHLIPLHSDEITQFNYFYRYIHKRVKDLNDEELNESFDILIFLFNDIRNSLNNYKVELEKFNFNELSTFFSILSEKDFEDTTTDVLINFAELINKFKNGKVENTLKKNLDKLYINNGRNALITHKLPSVNNRDSNIITASAYVRGDIFYDRVFFIGSPNYYYKYNTVFKAKDIYYVSYDIYHNNYKRELIIPNNNIKNSGVFKGVNISSKTTKDSKLDESKDIIMTDLSYDFIKVINRLSKTKESENINHSHNARAIELFDNQYILLPLNSKVRVLDEITNKIKIKNIKNLYRNDWIVLKKSSDEEYIKEMAKNIIGPNYHMMFREVVKYKKQLIQYMDENNLDLEGLQREMRKQSVLVHLNVLHDWVFGTTIAPREFNEVLNFLGYSPSSRKVLEDYYQQIMNAHRLSGRNLLKNIQKIIDTFDLATIKNAMDKHNTFNMNIDSIGEFCVKRVNGISNENLEVDYSELYKVLNIR